VVIHYPDHASGLRALLSLEDAHSALGLLDAAVMRMSAGGTLEIIDTAAMACARPGQCLTGAIFPAEVLAVPSVGPAASAADAHFRDQGFDRNLLKEIGENLAPGGAALVAVLEENWIAQFAATVDPHGDVVRFGRQTAA
jgi:uncharacterized membrane protein